MEQIFSLIEIEIGFHPDGYRIDKTGLSNIFSVNSFFA